MTAVPTRGPAVLRAAAALEARTHGLDDLVRLATGVLGTDFGFLTLVADDVETFVSVAGPLAAQLPATLSVAQSVCRHVVTVGTPLLVPDLELHPQLRDLAEPRLLGLRSYAGAPVTADDVVLGSFCVGSVAPRVWTGVEADLLTGLARAASNELRLLLALTRLEDVQALERLHAEQQAALHRVATAVARGDASGDVLRLVAEEVAGLLGARGAAVVRFTAGGRSEAVAGSGAVPSAALAGPCRALLEDVRAGRPAGAGEECAVAPVQVEGRTWGAVVVVRPAPDREAARASLDELAAFVSMVVVNTERQRALHDAARTDPLTGSANRRAFDERLGVELERSARHGVPLTLALLDVDRFKQVNDEHGHATGDKVLVELCARTGPGLRSIDLLARVGGDEWALLLPETGAEEAVVALERVRATVTAGDLAGVTVTVSVGAAVTASGRTTAGALYRAADQALYAAKAAGRDRVVVL